MYRRASENQTAMVTFLLHDAQSNPNSITRKGQTPLDVANKPEIIRLLLRNGAKPDSCFPSSLQSFPTDMVIKVYMLGNQGAGKSTLIKSLSTRGSLFSRFMHLFTKIKGVDGRTAGILPCDINSKDLGRLIIYDFAGHKEHYLCQNALSCRSIIIIVIDMRDEEGIIRETLQYWFQLISQNITDLGDHKPHLFIVDSHADKISRSNKNLKLRFIQSVISSYNLDNITFIRHINIDCRYAESFSMFQLRSVLSKSCKELRDYEEMDAVHHSFLIFLRDKFRDRKAVKLDDVVAELRNNVDNDEYIYLECLRSFNPFEMCEKLNEWGHILFVKNQGESWIVLDKDVLSHVQGILFPPKNFITYDDHRPIVTSTGVVPLSMLAPLFPGQDLDMIIQLLCHLEFCHEIQDSVFLSLLSADTESYPFLSTFERLFFFPNLVRSERPGTIFSIIHDIKYSSGWILESSRPKQYFSSRFLQVLLLRLTFTHTLPGSQSESTNDFILRRQCSLWMNGIHWATPFGVEAVVEVINLKQVVVVVRSTSRKLLNFVQLRSAIINQVLKAKEEFCPQVLVRESLIIPNDATIYPIVLNKVTTVVITDIAESIVQEMEFIITNNSKAISLQELLHFEPYNLGKLALKELHNEDESQNREITVKLLYHIAEHAYIHVDQYCAIFEQTPSQLVHTSTDPEKPQDNANIQRLMHTFQQWRDAEMGGKKEGTLRKFKQKLDQFSVLSGRNPFKLIRFSGK